MNIRDEMLYGQYLKKQQMKQDYLRQGESHSLLHQKSEKLSGLAKVAAELGEDLDLTKVMAKEIMALQSYLSEMETGYKGLPESIARSAVGQQMKQSIIMLRGAVARLDEAAFAPANQIPALLEEAAFLLEGADGNL